MLTINTDFDFSFFDFCFLCGLSCKKNSLRLLRNILMLSFLPIQEHLWLHHSWTRQNKVWKHNRHASAMKGSGSFTSEQICTRKQDFFVRPCKRRLLPKFSFSRVSVIGVFQKLGLERVIRAFSELVLTRENSFRLETRLESSEKSSECRALQKTHRLIESFGHYYLFYIGPKWSF